MRKLFYIIVCSLAFGMLASCGSNGGDNSAEATEQESETLNGDTATEHGTNMRSQEAIVSRLVEHDSIIKSHSDTIDVLEKRAETLEKENKDLKDDIDKIKNEKPIWISVSIIAFVLGLFALLTAWKAKPRKLRNEIEDIVNKQLKSKIKEKEVGQNSQTGSSNTWNTARLGNSSLQRICYLESEMAKVKEELKRQQKPVTQKTHVCKPVLKKTPAAPVVKYAKKSSGEYFMNLYPSCQEGCVFKITFISETKGEFTLLGLQTIQSLNDWQEKIVTVGGISIKDASSFEEVEKGICEKTNDGNVWKVTKPLKIKLIK